jgi:hypothetical protein
MRVRYAFFLIEKTESINLAKKGMGKHLLDEKVGFVLLNKEKDHTTK